MKITSRCGDDAIAGLNEALLAKAAVGKLLRTDRVRADTTVAQADVGYPTESGLLAQAVPPAHSPWVRLANWSAGCPQRPVRVSTSTAVSGCGVRVGDLHCRS